MKLPISQDPLKMTGSPASPNGTEMRHRVLSLSFGQFSLEADQVVVERHVVLTSPRKKVFFFGKLIMPRMKYAKKLLAQLVQFHFLKID